MHIALSIPERRLPIGAEVQSDNTVHFRVWAPKRRRVVVELWPHADAGQHTLRMELRAEGNGYFSAAADPARVGMLYGFRLDENQHLFPDPASRFQPAGPSGLSEIVDPGGFAWSDREWQGLTSGGQVIYEIHVGTLTREGTWEAATRVLPMLAEAGMTVLEIMPVADFSGAFGWGYDGVCLFAPTRLYGRPDDFRRFVNEAHRLGLGVILDVVYNHFGCVEHYLNEFSDDYATDRYKNEWGDSTNFDGERSGPVREFFLANARYWIDEFHLDGFRFDATQAIYDASPEPILSALVQTARHQAGQRSLLLIAENEPQDVRLIRSTAAGGCGMDAVWNEDFHHTAMVRLTGHNEAYYSDFLGSADEFLTTLKRGFIYQGQRSQWQRNPRGTPTIGLPATAFVNFLQNHDQVANSSSGERMHKLTSPGRHRAMTALWLLAPQTPMFFQGQEFSASSPFLYFADYNEQNIRKVTEGRINFLSQFPSLANAEVTGQLPDPRNRLTFERSKLDWSEREQHRQSYDLHTDLLKLRRHDPVFQRQRSDQLDGAALSSDCLAVRFFADNGHDRLLLVNFACDLSLTTVPQPLLAPPSGLAWELLWSSESLRYGGRGIAPAQTDHGWRIPGEAAVLFQAVK